MTELEAADLQVGQKIQFNTGQIVIVVVNDQLAGEITVRFGSQWNPIFYPQQVIPYTGLAKAHTERLVTGGPGYDVPSDGQTYTRG
jgi:hypothetical protein